MKKIKDLVIGQSVAISLLVQSAEIKETRNQKPYLYATLFDGKDSITANHWDYGKGDPPPRNSVINVTATVAEWQGNPQLNVKTISYNNEIPVTEFAPSGDVDIQYYTGLAADLIGNIHHDELRNVTRKIFNDFSGAWKTRPAANSIHHAYVGGLLKHSVDVTMKARAIAQLEPDANIDLVTAGALLHDFGKIWGYALDGAIIEFTIDGNLLEHMALGIARLEAYRTDTNGDIIRLLQHIVGSHHGRVEYGATTPPKFLEALIVSAADGIDAKVESLKVANSKAKPEDIYTSKIWAFDNKPMLTQTQVRRFLGC